MIVWCGGRQGRHAQVADRDHTPLYVEGVFGGCDGDQIELRLRDRATIGRGSCFKGISRRAGGDFVLAHDAEVVVADAKGRVRERRSGFRFNDVHHAVDGEGVRWVVSTGLDAVLEDDVEIVLGEDMPEGDVRCVDLRPHAVHPNHLFACRGRTFVTCGGLGHVRSVEGDLRWDVADVMIHDGIVRPDGVWFTAVDGRLVRVDPDRGVVDGTLDLRPISEREGPLGWCRGLAFAGGIAWVGFTRLRATRWRRRLAWMRGQIRGSVHASAHPTRIVGYDLDRGRQVTEVITEGEGADALFGLLPADPSADRLGCRSEDR